MPFDRITNSIYTFISAMKKIGVAAGLVLLVFLGIMVYVDYKPINNLADEMSVRNRLILDLLLGNLLYGLPIPKKEAEELGLSKHTGSFCVITVFDVKFLTGDRKSLTAVLSDRFSVTSYITDILYQNHTVIICLLPSSGIELLRAYLQAIVCEPGSFEIGPAVNSLSEIKNSYQASLERNRNGKGGKGIPKSPVLQKKAKNAEADAQAFRDKVLHYVQEQFNNPQLSQINVADHFGVSIYSLSRLFNNEIGIGFVEFIAAKRMEQARTLLLSTDKDIMEIAAAVGISNANYFSRLFKSYFGIIPSRYRVEAARSG